MSVPRNVTMVDDLPDIGQLEGNGSPYMNRGGDNLPPEIQNQYQQKYIRGDRHVPAAEAGMSSYGEQHQEMPQEYGGSVQMDPPPNMALSIPCIEISNHIRDCPICSKFYNSDKTLYIIIIIILAVVCVLLLKKVLDGK